jgi:hypothetical protein
MPLLPSLLSPAIQQASWTSEWLHILAAERGISVIALCRELKTSHQLVKEIARIIVRDGQADARYYLSEKKTPPRSDTPSLREQVCAHYYELLRDHQLALMDDASDAALDEIIAKQKATNTP